MSVAHRSERLDENVAGKYYVDSGCAGCGACLETAPGNFSTDEEEGHSYVSKQPENVVEEAQCREAMGWCPVAAIGDDGLEPRPAPHPRIGSRLVTMH